MMQEEGIPTVVWLSPILPFINDTEENIRGILDACRAAGVRGIMSFGTGVTLRDGDRQYFYRKLDEHFPGMKERYIRNFGNAYEILSPDAPFLDRLTEEECRKAGMLYGPDSVFSYLHAFEDKEAGQQLSLPL